MKNKNFKVLTCLILLCIIFINSFLQCFAFDKENSNNVDLFVSKANNNIINSNSESTADEIGETTSFALDSVVVQMTNKASLELKDYSVSDFSEVDAISVEDLTEYSTEKIKEQRKNDIEDDKNNVSTVSENDFYQTLEIKLSTNDIEGINRAINALDKRDDIINVQPNYICKAASVPNDTCKNDQYAIEKMELNDAWNLTTGNHSFKVGIIDTGINRKNPDLVNRYDAKLSKSFVDSYSSDVSGYDEHGTHVAGIIGAEGNNAKGIAGVCWDVSLVSLRTADNKGDSYNTNVIKAIEYAKKNNIKLLNFSSSGVDYDESFKNAIKSYKGLIVCSSGNDYKNLDGSFNSYPTEYRLPNVISVGSCDYYDVNQDYSNYSPNFVDLVAPGEGILSTYSNSYIYKSGTSMAAPQVTGVAALIWSKYPNLSVAEVKAAILNNVDKVSYLKDKVKTGGRLNAFKALSSIENKKYTVHYNSNGGLGSMDDLTIIYGKTTCMDQNQFKKEGYEFSGWYAHRKNDNKWLYTNGTRNAWYVENSQPSDYYKFLYNDKARIAKTSSYNNDIITMYAQWLLDGDMDFDEVLSVMDATLLQKYLSGLVTFDKKQKLVADFNNDNIIDIKDATEIQKKLVGLSD